MTQQAQVTIYVDKEGNVSSEVNQGNTELSKEEIYKVAGEHIASKTNGCVCGVLFKLFPDKSIKSLVLGVRTSENFLQESPWILQLIRCHIDRLLKEENPNSVGDIVDILHNSNGDGVSNEKSGNPNSEVVLDEHWP